VLGPWLVDGVEHVGSTAVPGLSAKPIIDLIAAVFDVDTVVAQASQQLVADGWCQVPPDLDQRPWRRFFVKPDRSGQKREAHVQLVQTGHPQWIEQIRFRDILRGDSQLAQKYQDLKQRLADQHGDNREVYTEGKTEFVASVLGKAA
jgi:GrpB-like predicted nucleotidyltransferase (UPF0157 family)